ncbi:hypothetical protein HRG_006855 [Hirsutella rhossiliensis]|uniref:DUF7580 domain-containing protein n=1 Tax=Hirsutella rhossiliensis TaxID=111463 RepID=A0A9P8SHP5_9HYPO|nr:uncharacterized protein HRG_06855 [Hirsutella rhossiliensis]KAH0961775.1 hypothetical protein HRG_06855 [Hirsutella rhossiliensis]
MKVFFKWRQQLGTFVRELYMGHTSFAQSISLLLKQSVESSELNEMIDKPGCDLWRRTNLVEDLEQRLGIAYKPCMSTIQEIAEILMAIAGSLDIEGADKVTVLGLQAIVFANPPDPTETVLKKRYHFRRRINLVMDRRTISGLLKRLKRCNTRLYEFLEKADRIHDDVFDSRVKIRRLGLTDTRKQFRMQAQSCLLFSGCDAPASATRVGFRLDSTEVLRGPYLIDTPCTFISNTTTLSDLLTDMKRADFPDRDRYTLAITLASSLLQLSETPWLEHPWSKRDILFLRIKEDSHDSPDIEHPYLTQGYESTATGARAVNNQPISRRNLLSLAILLLEIRFGIPIERRQQPEDLGPDGEANEATDLTTAGRWLRREADKGSLSTAFLQAITYCLKCYIDPSATFGNPDFSKAVEDKVLEPLDREMKYLFA